jgi:hypothetical protein
MMILTENKKKGEPGAETTHKAENNKNMIHKIQKQPGAHSPGVQLAQTDRGLFHFRRAAFSTTLKAKVGSTLVKVADLRITLNIQN